MFTVLQMKDDQGLVDHMRSGASAKQNAESKSEGQSKREAEMKQVQLGNGFSQMHVVCSTFQSY